MRGNRAQLPNRNRQKTHLRRRDQANLEFWEPTSVNCRAILRGTGYPIRQHHVCLRFRVYSLTCDEATAQAAGVPIAGLPEMPASAVMTMP